MPKYDLPYKPDPTVRRNLIDEGVKLFPLDELKKKHTKTLKALETYLEAYLVMLCGTQVWDILDQLTAVEGELHNRRKKKENKQDGHDS